ncbi:SOS response-associated peptidase [Limnoglobus roseus]|uniref:Abasic site processing protein n=1 Tax=Limnoglobus roseus TaxID=2598579 RepID=A0A5C1A8I3_9BACT|nr:SOS response-associated peptidase [Limnoglobus roseus]QEL14815.1 SOS response-associated peptidase [Limnoglobus roseus]
MCGRFTLTASADDVAAEFEVPDPPLLQTRYNVAPSQVIAVVGLKPDGKRRGIALLRWGLVPNWAADPNTGPRPINVRAESIVHKFGAILRENRCLIPADGFYEWKTEGKKKTPQRFTLKTGKPFAFAGLWDVWGEGKQKLVTCCLVTTEANAVVRPYHDRMPVIVPPESYAEWLAPETSMPQLTALLRPYPAEAMRSNEANPAVNSPKNDGPECLVA